MRVASANLGRGVTVKAFTTSLRKLMVRMAGGVIAFQEIDEADLPPERRIIGTLMRHAWWFAGRRTKVMIAIPRMWVRVDGRVRHACDGREGVTPERKIVAIVIRPHLQLARTSRVVGIVNVHYPYRAPDLWDDVHRALVREVAYWVDKRGVSVFITADTNVFDNVQPHKHAKLLAGAGQRDRIWFVKAIGGTEFDLTATGHHRLGIDSHRAVIVRGNLT